MEWPAQSLDLNPIENMWDDIKNTVSEAKPKKCRGILPVHRCQTPCNTDVKQFSETVAIQLNVSSVIHKKAKSSSIFQFIQYMFLLCKEKCRHCYFFEQPDIPFSSISVKVITHLQKCSSYFDLE